MEKFWDMKVFYQIVLPYEHSSFPLSWHSILADVAAWFPANFEYVAVKAKPECCSEQNRNREKRLVERASVHDFAFKTTIIEG